MSNTYRTRLLAIAGTLAALAMIAAIAIESAPVTATLAAAAALTWAPAAATSAKEGGEA